MSVWYPNAIRVNGANANYQAGRNRMEVVKLHFTVGFNSWGVGYRGYFQFLISRDGLIYQFAPVDAACWDSSEWNDAGPGIEAEFYPGVDDVVLNAAMIEAARGLILWLHHEHGFPLVKKADGRIGEWDGFRGFLDHNDLIQTSPHYDYWPDDAWALITRATHETGPHAMERLVKNKDLPDGAGWYYFPPTGRARHVADPLEVIALAETGLPDFHASGGAIVAADLRRA